MNWTKLPDYKLPITFTGIYNRTTPECVKERLYEEWKNQCAAMKINTKLVWVVQVYSGKKKFSKQFIQTRFQI